MLIAALAMSVSFGYGAGGNEIPAPKMQKSSEQRAIDHYNAGLRHRDKAWKHQEKALASTRDRDRRKYEQRAQREFGKAAKRYRSALEYQPKLYQAHGSLGYALKEMSDYDAAISAYDASLALRPQYTPAIEYLAEAHLALGKIEQTQQAYDDLVRLDPVKADELMEAINRWVAASPENISSEAIAQMAAWVAARKP
tara:strand:- start:341 stop:931 length:591 start_codon:yes stop_codon:yes gene_type:complete